MTELPDSTLPNFLVAGAARSGTTGLVEGLRTHSRVFVTSPKEPHYFALHELGADFQGPGDAATINRVAVVDRSDYLALYPAQHDFLALGDGSVSTLYYADQAAPEIVRVSPEMRIVIILREPVARAYSGYLYLRARGFEPCADFLDAVAEEPRRTQDNWHHLWHYVAMGHYGHGIRVLREALGPEQVGVWFYDDLESDYQGTVGSVQDFLGLPEDGDQDLDVPRVNVSGTPRVAFVQRAIQLATGNERVRSTVKSMTSFGFRERIRRGGLRPSEVPAQARAELAPRYVESLAELATLIDGPVPDWLRA